MRSVGRFSYARIAYLAAVSIALAVVSVRTFADSDNEPLTVPSTASEISVTTDADTTVAGSPSSDAPAASSTPTTRAPAGRRAGQGTSSNTAPVPDTVPVVTTTVNTVAPTTTSQYPPNAIVMVIPFGTFDRIQGGDDVEDVMPSVLNARVGQTLYLVNNDEYAHRYGNLAVNPYRTAVYPFTYPGDQVGFCTVGPSKTITFRVSA